ncbi:hypothetical protein LA324_09765 [Corynebacterium coyleae]|uniref:hypothetical protein n=1 Tax=Corynebacterium coyleae TaxID=53374 RepID=UPI001CCCBBFC|nr:hypothetical protein [Corynebacterium coyleae]UBI08605.1 hypothetical protein LA324_09765 [Corynebacterium coyleae]
MNYFEAEEMLMKDLQVSVRHPFSPVRDEVLLRDCIKASEEGRIPDREAKRIWVEEWEEPIKYDVDIYSRESLADVFRAVEQFASMEPVVKVNLPSLDALFSNDK